MEKKIKITLIIAAISFVFLSQLAYTNVVSAKPYKDASPSDSNLDKYLLNCIADGEDEIARFGPLNCDLESGNVQDANAETTYSSAGADVSTIDFNSEVESMNYPGYIYDPNEEGWD